MVSEILNLVGRFIPDKNKQAELAAKLETEFTKQMELKADIIRQEQKLGGLASKWRPWTMIAFVGMIVTHWLMYDVAPWAVVVFDLNVYTPQDPGFTDGLLEVVKLGLGGYLAGRSVEKGLAIWRRK